MEEYPHFKIMKVYSRNFTITIISIILILFISEVGLRVIKVARKQKEIQDLFSSDAYDKAGIYNGKYPTQAEMEYNTYLGYIFKANSTGNGYKINSHHFRYNENFPINKEKNEIRIFIAGGSAAWGAGVFQDDTYFSLMEKKFQKEYPDFKIRVISGGVIGYCSTQERIMIENFFLKFQPDVVVMFSGFNDVYWGYSGVNILENQDYYRPNKKNNKIIPPEYNDYLSKIHYLIAKSIYRYKNRNRSNIEKIISDNSIEPQEAVNTLIQNINIISDISKRYNFKLIFYLQPTLYTTLKELSKREEEKLKFSQKYYVYFNEYLCRLYELYREILPKSAKTNGFVFIDADKAIANEEKSVFIDHCHFGDRGNRLIKEHLYDKIVENIFKDSEKGSNLLDE